MLVLVPLFGVIYIASIVVTLVYPAGQSVKADIIYLYGEMFYNSFQVIKQITPLKAKKANDQGLPCFVFTETQKVLLHLDYGI